MITQTKKNAKRTALAVMCAVVLFMCFSAAARGDVDALRPQAGRQAPRLQDALDPILRKWGARVSGPVRLLVEEAADDARAQFVSMDYHPGIPHNNTSVEGLRRGVGLLRAYHRIASRENIRRNYEHRSLADPLTRTEILRDDMLPNIVTPIENIIDDLQEHWDVLDAERRTAHRATLTREFLDYLVVHRLAVEIDEGLLRVYWATMRFYVRRFAAPEEIPEIAALLLYVETPDLAIDQAIMRSRAILASVEHYGILSPDEQARREIVPNVSADYGLEGTAASLRGNAIFCNVVVSTNPQENHDTVRRALLNESNGMLQVAMERSFDVHARIIDLPQDVLTAILYERLDFNVIALIDPEKLEPYDRRALAHAEEAGVFSVNASVHVHEFDLRGPIPPEAIECFIAQPRFSHIVHEIFPGKTTIATSQSGRREEILIHRKVTSQGPVRGSSYQRRFVTIDVRDYDAILERLLERKGRLIMHAIRLVAPSDLRFESLGVRSSLFHTHERDAAAQESA